MTDQHHICCNCGLRIHLIQTGKDSYKWVTNPDKPHLWKCGKDPAFPVRAHAPAPAAGEIK